jgi:hypothetical protein
MRRPCPRPANHHKKCSHAFNHLLENTRIFIILRNYFVREAEGRIVFTKAMFITKFRLNVPRGTVLSQHVSFLEAQVF